MKLHIHFNDKENVISGYADSINNWVPVQVTLNVLEETYAIAPEVKAKLNFFEVQFMLKKMEEMICDRKSGKSFDIVEISTLEFNYKLKFEEILEEDLISCTFSFFEGNRIYRVVEHIERSFTFYTNLENISAFLYSLETEFKEVVH